MTVDRDAVLAQALVEEVCKKSSLVWLRPVGTTHSQAVWHAWIDGAVRGNRAEYESLCKAA